MSIEYEKEPDGLWYASATLFDGEADPVKMYMVLMGDDEDDYEIKMDTSDLSYVKVDATYLKHFIEFTSKAKKEFKRLEDEESEI